MYSRKLKYVCNFKMGVVIKKTTVAYIHICYEQRNIMPLMLPRICFIIIHGVIYLNPNRVLNNYNNLFKFILK